MIHFNGSFLSGNAKFDLNFYDLINSKAEEETGNTYTIEKFKELIESAGDGEARLDAWFNTEWTMDVWLRDMDITLDNNCSVMNYMATTDDDAWQLI